MSESIRIYYGYFFCRDSIQGTVIRVNYFMIFAYYAGILAILVQIFREIFIVVLRVIGHYWSSLLCRRSRYGRRNVARKGSQFCFVIQRYLRHKNLLSYISIGMCPQLVQLQDHVFYLLIPRRSVPTHHFVQHVDHVPGIHDPFLVFAHPL